jgi:hypothetical protein
MFTIKARKNAESAKELPVIVPLLEKSLKDVSRKKRVWRAKNKELQSIGADSMVDDYVWDASVRHPKKIRKGKVIPNPLHPTDTTQHTSLG